jgi:hypothetical protein
MIFFLDCMLHDFFLLSTWIAGIFFRNLPTPSGCLYHCMAFTKKIARVRALYLNKKDEEIAKVLSPIAWLANKLYAIEGSQRGRVVTDLVYCLAQRCKLVFSATRTLLDHTRTYPGARGYLFSPGLNNENQSVHRAVSKLVKTAINTATTGKLLKSKVTLLNTCEKLKMTQREHWE